MVYENIPGQNNLFAISDVCLSVFCVFLSLVHLFRETLCV